MNEMVVFDQPQDQEEFAQMIVESRGENLPMEISEIVKVFEFTSMKAEAYRVIVRHTKKLEEAQVAHDSALESGQKWGAAALYSEARVGELLPSAKEALHAGRGSKLPDGFSGDGGRAAIAARAIANNPETVEEVIKEAEADHDVPSRGDVLRKVKKAKQSQVNERVEDRKREYEVSEEEQKYLDSLDSAFLLISRAPKTLTDAGLVIVQKKLNRIQGKIEEILG